MLNILQYNFNIQDRKPIWVALSAFYLDTELQDFDFQHIARKIIESPYSFEKIKLINKYEVFPVLKSNLLQVAGEWVRFDEDWLIEIISSRLTKKTKLSSLFTEISYWLFQKMFNDYWQKLEVVYAASLIPKSKE